MEAGVGIFEDVVDGKYLVPSSTNILWHVEYRTLLSIAAYHIVAGTGQSTRVLLSLLAHSSYILRIDRLLNLSGLVPLDGGT